MSGGAPDLRCSDATAHKRQEKRQYFVVARLRQWAGASNNDKNRRWPSLRAQIREPASKAAAGQTWSWLLRDKARPGAGLLAAGLMPKAHSMLGHGNLLFGVESSWSELPGSGSRVHDSRCWGFHGSGFRALGCASRSKMKVFCEKLLAVAVAA